MMLEPVREFAVDWLNNKAFSDAFIFGSLIHKGGAQFDPAISDVDLVCQFRTPDTYHTRWKSVLEAIDPTAHLNLSLLKLFGRQDASTPIVSIVPVSQCELEMGIHKDRASQFFSHNTFHNVTTGNESSLGNELASCSTKLECRFNAIREAQRYRNTFLSISPAGTRAVEDYNGSDVLPKQLSRCAAQVRWALYDEPKEDQRFDVNEGFVYMVQILTARRNEFMDVDDLLQRIMIRMGGRGASGPLTPADQLLLWEMLVDDAEAISHIAEVEEPVSANPILCRRQIPAATREAVLHRAGSCCSYPGCGVPLGVNGIGEIAHIISPNEGGPRHDPSISTEQVNQLDNLLLLCPTHHRMIDRNPDDYPVDTLKEWNQMERKEHPLINAANLFTIIRLVLKLIS